MGWKQWRGDRLKRRTHTNIAAAMFRAGQAILGVANQQVPLDEGTLQSTGIVKVDPSNDHRVIISYGGGAGTGFARVPYAIKWHETEANFQHGRKSNYLRDPVQQDGPGMIKKELKKAGKQSW